MNTTPSNRLKLTPANSPYSRTSRSPVRGRAGYGGASVATSGVGGGAASGFESRLSLQRVVGTTCTGPTGFDTAGNEFAYIAGGAVVVVDVHEDHSACGSEPGRNEESTSTSTSTSTSGRKGETKVGGSSRGNSSGGDETCPRPRQTYTQRFFRARPTAVPVYPTTVSGSGGSSAPVTPNSTPKANDSRNRVSLVLRDSPYGSASAYDWSGGGAASSDSPTSGRTWTQRERIKAATCLALSRDGRFLAVGETGYAPRVLIFGLQHSGGAAAGGDGKVAAPGSAVSGAVSPTGAAPASSPSSAATGTMSTDIPLVAINEHAFGVRAVAWSRDSRFLASLGAATDGFLYIWRVDPRTGAAKLFQQNRCTANVRGMVWLNNGALVTFGVRHVKLWRVEENGAGDRTSSIWSPGGTSGVSPIKQRFQNEFGSGTVGSGSPSQRTLPGRNILLGSMLEATFSCAAAISDDSSSGGSSRALVCSENGDLCLFDDSTRQGQGGQLRLVRLLDLGFSAACMAIRGGVVYIGARSGQLVTLDLDRLLSLAASAASASGSRQERLERADSFAACILSSTKSRTGLLALGFLTDKLVTVDTKRSVEVRPIDCIPGQEEGKQLQDDESRQIRIPGHGEPVLGIQLLDKPNRADADFFTWSGSGRVILWNLEGHIEATLDVPLDFCGGGASGLSSDLTEAINQLNVVRATRGGKLFLAADKLGVIKAIDFDTRETVLEMKAHATECQSITIREDDSESGHEVAGGGRLLMASCGRDRTAQLFHRSTRSGAIELFQTLEFPSKVVQVLITSDGQRVITCSLDRTLQVHELVTKEGDPDAIAAIQARVVSLKASPASMVVSADERSVFVSLVDRSVCVFDLDTGRAMQTFKCTDEAGVESVVLDSLVLGGSIGRRQRQPEEQRQTTTTPPASDMSFLLGISNTDKSVRIYDSQSGAFLDREWGHTEAINGAILIEDEDELGVEPVRRRVVSVGSDGTIMLWALDLSDPAARMASAAATGSGSSGRDPSPVKEAQPSASTRPPLRRVLSKAELAEFARSSLTSPSSASSTATAALPGGGRRSPPRPLLRRASRYGLTGLTTSNNNSNANPASAASTASTAGSGSSVLRTPVSAVQTATSPSSISENTTPSRRASSTTTTAATSRSGSPPLPSLTLSSSVSSATSSTRASLSRRPSLPAMRSASAGSFRAKSMTNLRASICSNGGSSASTASGTGTGSSSSSSSPFGSIGMATEQTSRALRAYRKRLATNTTDPIGREALAELDRELRLTAAALGDRAVALSTTKADAVRESILLSGLLDQCSERIVELVGERLRKGLLLERPDQGAVLAAEPVKVAAAPAAPVTEDDVMGCGTPGRLHQVDEEEHEAAAPPNGGRLTKVTTA